MHWNFEPVDIDARSFRQLVAKLTYEFSSCEDGSIEDFLERSLRLHVFNVKPEFLENEWNRCTIPPPDDFCMNDLIIRKKGLAPIGRRVYTYSTKAYRLAHYNGSKKIFETADNNNAFNEDEDLKDFEYLLIK